ncbi:MAG: trigger factor [Ktedonobacterales bacterium]
MKVSVERTPESEAVLNVELDWVELEKASDKAYRKLAQQYNVPGFRKGHAPRSMLERMLGKEAIYQEGLEDLIETSYRDAVREHDLKPISRPSLDAPPIEIGQPYTFKARVPVLPEVELGDYKAVQVEQPSTEVTDEDVANLLNRIREDQAMWLPVERPAQIGDKITVDLKLTVGDRTVSDLHDNEFELVDERVGIFAGMDQHIVGMSEGETKEFTTTIPEDYANTELAGKEAAYTVTLKSAKYRELPELDDELAKSVGDYETVEDLRTAVRQQLQEQKESEARRQLRDEVVKAVADAATVEVHPVLVDDEVHVMIDEMKRMLAQNRISFEQFLAMSNKTEQEYHDDLQPEARERAKRDLVLDAVADAEHLEADDQEIEGWLQIFSAMGGKRMRLRDLSAGQRANIVSRLRRDKAISRLVEIATENGPATPTTGTAESETAQSEAAAKAAASAGAASGSKSKSRKSATTAAPDAATDEATADAGATAAAGAEAPSESDV